MQCVSSSSTIPMLDRPIPPTKPPPKKSLGGGGNKYYIKAICKVVLSKNQKVVLDVWGTSKSISISKRVEETAKDRALEKFKMGTFDVSPPECSFIAGEEPEDVETVYWLYK